jgi:hypothetical protein
VIGVPVELCEGKHCINPLIKSVFWSISAIPAPGNATLTSSLHFKDVIANLKSANFYKYARLTLDPHGSRG